MMGSGWFLGRFHMPQILKLIHVIWWLLLFVTWERKGMYPDVDTIEYLWPQNIFLKWHCPEVPSMHQGQLKLVLGWLPRKGGGNESLQGISWLGFPPLAVSCPGSEGSIKAKELSATTSLLKTPLACACPTAVFYFYFLSFSPLSSPSPTLLHPLCCKVTRKYLNPPQHVPVGHFLEGLSGFASTPETLKGAEALGQAEGLVLSILTYELYSFPLR